jgi:hypothetical protein
MQSCPPPTKISNFVIKTLERQLKIVRKRKARDSV